jgi:hypothetical protein
MHMFLTHQIEKIPSLFAPKRLDCVKEEEMVPYLHCALLSGIIQSPRKTALAAGLQGSDAQHMVNFLTKVGLPWIFTDFEIHPRYFPSTKGTRAWRLPSKISH